MRIVETEKYAYYGTTEYFINTKLFDKQIVNTSLLKNETSLSKEYDFLVFDFNFCLLALCTSFFPCNYIFTWTKMRKLNILRSQTSDANETT